MSRTKRRERREGHFSLPLALSLFVVFALMLGVAAAGMALLAMTTRLETLERRTSVQLDAAVDGLHAALDLDLLPAHTVLASVRDVLVAEPQLLEDTNALRARMVLLLRYQPDIQSLRLRAGEERAWEIQRDGEAWRTRRTVEGDPARNTVWERWNSAATERGDEEPAQPLLGMEKDADYQEALTAMRGLVGGNRYGTPELRWNVAESALMQGSLVFDRDVLPPVWINVGVKLTNTTDEAVRARGLEQKLVATRDSVAVALAPELAAVSFAAHPMGGGLKRWLTDTYPPESAYAQRIPEGAWWFVARPYALASEQDLVLLAGVPESALLQGEHDLRNRTLVGVGIGLAIAALAAWLVSRSVGRPLREFMKRTRRVDVLDRQLGFRPRSRIREVDQLFEALDDLSAEVSERVHSREMPLVITAEAVRKSPGETGEALSIAGPSDGALAEVSDEAAAEDAMYIPEAYVQAIQTTRRKLRHAGEEIELHRAKVRALEQHKEEEQHRWLQTRDAAAALSEAFARHGHDYDTFVADAAHRLLMAADGTRCTLWQVEGAFERLLLTHRADKLEPGIHAPVALEREHHPLLFAALDAAPTLSVRDASLDPRTTSYAAAVPWTPAPCALLAVPVHVREGIAAVLIMEHATSTTPWPASTESLASMAAAALGAAWELSRKPAPLGVPPEDTAKDDEDEYAEPPLYRQLIEGAGGAVFALDRQGRVTFANTAAERLYGRPARTWPGTRLTDLSASGYADADENAFRRILRGETRVDTDSEHVTAGGASATLRLTWTPLEDEEGEVEGAVVLAVDIRDIRDHQGMLRQNEARLRGYVEGLAGVFFSLDEAGCINYVSPAVEQLYGYGPAELTGCSMAMLASEEQAARDANALSALLSGGACSGYETIHHTKTGEPVRLVVFASLRRAPDEQIAGVTGVVFARPSG